jgi:hypothetical protein
MQLLAHWLLTWQQDCPVDLYASASVGAAAVL